MDTQDKISLVSPILTSQDTLNKDNITVVSGYWRVNNKYGGHDKYNEWFKNSLQINQRYYFFCEETETDYIKSFRKDLETIYIPYSLNDFYFAKHIDKHWVHPTHVPSIELSMIWHEKIHLMKLAKDTDTKDANKDSNKDKYVDKTTEFYVWIDAGICNFRNSSPPLKRLNISVNSLPHDKICYSKVKGGNYHRFSGGVLIMHKDIIDNVHSLYLKTLLQCKKSFKDWRCGSDQFVWTQMTKIYPNLFKQICKGYGQNLNVLYDLS